MGRMDEVLDVNSTSGIVTCQAGVILEQLDSHVAEFGLMVPLDLGAKGSCQIGGNVATNAGGLRLLRYGSLQGSVLGLEVVLSSGQVLRMLEPLRKDNTGLHLHHLFIGAEGILGVITAVSLLCPPRPRSTHVAFLSCPSFQHATLILARARAQLGEILSACEFMDEGSVRLATQLMPGRAVCPLEEGQAPFYVLVETQGSCAEADGQKVEAFLEGLLSEGVAQDATLAASLAEAASIWALREAASECLPLRGAVYKYDFSLPVARMYDIVHMTRQQLGDSFPEAVVVGYGHLGDGNVHLNISHPTPSPALKAALEPFVYEACQRMQGSISAEHGIGQLKVGALRYSKAEEVVEIMRQVKGVFDPAGILNPGKVLP